MIITLAVGMGTTAHLFMIAVSAKITLTSQGYIVVNESMANTVPRAIVAVILGLVFQCGIMTLDDSVSRESESMCFYIQLAQGLLRKQKVDKAVVILKRFNGNMAPRRIAEALSEVTAASGSSEAVYLWKLFNKSSGFRKDVLSSCLLTIWMASLE